MIRRKHSSAANERAKFGLPDVVVSDFSWCSNRSVGNLINLFAQAMVEGAVITTPGVYDLDLRSVKNANVRQGQLATLKPNATAIAKLSLVKGTWEDGDPRNRLVEIRFDRYRGPDHYARQEAMLGGLFGFEDSVQRVRHTNELLEASKAANAKLPGLRRSLQTRLAAARVHPGEGSICDAGWRHRMDVGRGDELGWRRHQRPS